MPDENSEEHDDPDESVGSRSTAPQSEYTAKRIATGFVVALGGLAVTFGVPLAMSL